MIKFVTKVDQRMRAWFVDAKMPMRGALAPRARVRGLKAAANIRIVRQDNPTYFIIISFFTDVKVLPVPDTAVAFMRMK